MSFLDLDMLSFAQQLSSKAPVPGGGGACAYAGALGAALCSMAAELSSGKPHLMQHQSDIAHIIEKAGTLQEKLCALVDGDAEAFLPLAAAYSIPHDAPDRAQIMEKCLREAAGAPMQMLRYACQSIELHRELMDKCYSLSISDVATGAMLSRAAMYGAAMNVRVNTHYMKDREWAQAADAEVDALVKKYGTLADEVYESIWKNL